MPVCTNEPHRGQLIHAQLSSLMLAQVRFWTSFLHKKIRRGRTADIACASELRPVCASDARSNPNKHHQNLKKPKTTTAKTQITAHRNIQGRALPPNSRQRPPKQQFFNVNHGPPHGPPILYLHYLVQCFFQCILFRQPCCRTVSF